MGHFVHTALQWVDRLGPKEWLIILGAMILVGAVCLRGFGSRRSY